MIAGALSNAKGLWLGVSGTVIYLYECGICNVRHEVEKPSSQCHEFEVCRDCGSQMIRIYTAPHVGVREGTFQEGYNPGLGKAFKNKREMREHIRRHEGETGNQLIEVGNEKLTGLKPKRKEYDGQDAAEWLRATERNPHLIREVQEADK